MKKLLLTLSCFISAFAMQAQSSDQCGASFVHEHQMATDPVYAQKMAAFEEFRLSIAGGGLTTLDEPNYVIPVVVHILHRGEAIGNETNLSEEEIKKQIEVVNQRYRKTAGSLGDGGGVDTGIQFALATRDPNGQCTNGITRTDLSGNAAYMQYGLSYGNENGLLDADMVAMAGWDSSKYYNIYVVTQFSGAPSTTGFAYYASSHGGLIDGARILNYAFRDSSEPTTAHEIGHALNLRHTFEGSTATSCPPEVNGCGSGLGDCCQDTPPHKSTDNCFTQTVNSCDVNNTDMSYLHNYMSYSHSSCRDSFTADQKSRMITTLTTVRASYLAQNGNMSLVSPQAPQAAFEIAIGTDCKGHVKLLDKSSCTPNTYIFNTTMPGTTYLWTISNGTNTYTSASQNPDMEITQPGVYNVSLTVTNSQGNDTHTANNFLIVSGEITSHCAPNTTLNNQYNLTINKVTFNQIDNVTDSITGGPYLDFLCRDNTLVLPGQTYPLSISTYAHSSTNDPICYKAYIDYNNNGVFEAGELVSEGTNTGNQTQVFTENVTIPQNAVQNTLLTLRVIGNGGKLTISPEQVACEEYLFIGDVEDYGVYVKGTLGTDEHTASAFIVSPNPVENTFTISGDAQIDNIAIYNMLGQIVFKEEITTRQPQVNIAHLSTGAYMVHASSEDKTTILKIIKK